MLFIRQQWLGLRTFVLAMMAIALIVFDAHYHTMAPVRSAVESGLTPVKALVDLPFRALENISAQMKSVKHLAKKNIELQTSLQLLQAKLQQLSSLEHENNELRQLLQSTRHLKHQMQVARVSAVAMAPYVQELTINKGAKDHVVAGQAVLDAHGVMGQVFRVYPHHSSVLLITDNRAAIPVQIERNGVRGIVVGTGKIKKMRMVHMPDTTDILPGDRLITSGLGGVFPIGFEVARVGAITHNPGQDFAEITVNPAAHLQRSLQVLLLRSPNSEAHHVS